MRNLLLLLLFPLLINAQDFPDWTYHDSQPISTDFPLKFPITFDYLQAQMTYYDYNFTSNNLSNLIKSNFKLKRVDDIEKDNYLIDVYVSNSNKFPLKIKYNCFVFYRMYIASSIYIEGSFSDVAKLFIYLYGTSLSTFDMPKNKAQKYYKLDHAVFTNLSNGKASINITNTKYSNNDVFKTDFNVLKNQYKTDLLNEKERIDDEDKELAIQQYKDSINWIKDKKESRKNDSIARFQYSKSKPIKQINVYYFSKKGDDLNFKNQPSIEVEKEINKKVSGYKRGNYSAYVTTITTNENKTYEIKINLQNRI